MKPDDYFATSAAPAGPSTPDRAWQADAAVRYQALFDAASDAIFLMDGERFVDCNSMTLHVFGCTRDQIVGQPPYRFSPPAQPDGRDSAQAAREWIVAAIESGPQRFEWLHMRYDGTPFHAEVSLNRLDLGGRVYLQAIVRDVTERKQAEDAIRRSEARYRDLFDKASDGIVVCAASLEILDANPSFARMTGHALEELRGRRIVELYADAPSEDRVIRQVGRYPWVKPVVPSSLGLSGTRVGGFSKGGREGVGRRSLSKPTGRSATACRWPVRANDAPLSGAVRRFRFPGVGATQSARAASRAGSTSGA